MLGKYTLKANEKEARERHRAFWNNQSLGRPLIFAIANKRQDDKTEWNIETPSKQRDLLPKWHVNSIENYFNSTEFLADAMPIASLMVGLDITNTAVLAGGAYDYGPLHDQIIFSKGTFDINKPISSFNKDLYLVRELKKCYEEVIKAVGSRGCVNTPMTLDALSSIYHLHTPEGLLTDLIRRPELIKKRTRELTEVYLQFYDYFYDFLLAKGYGESSSWFQVFAEGKFESVRCDFSLMLSTEMFETFVLPELHQVCDHMDYSLFNMSSVRHARFIDSLAKIKSLKGVFWNPEPYLSSIPKYIDALQRIKEKGMCLQIVCYTVEDAVFAARELGPDGLYLYLHQKFETTLEAEGAVEKIVLACK